MPDQRVEIIEDQLIYTKIPCDSNFSPLYIKTQYEKQAELKMYISFSNQMPGPGDAYKSYRNPRSIKLYAPDNERKFPLSIKFIYVSFFCHAPTTLYANVRYTSEEEALGRKRAQGN